MIATIIILTLAFGYLLFETKGLTVRLLVGKEIVAEKPNLVATDTPYYWKPDKTNMILCHNCRNRCSRKNERWTAWKLPAKTIKVFDQTLNLYEGCNIARAKLLKEVVNAQKVNRQPTLRIATSILCDGQIEPICGKDWIEAHKDFEYPEPTIEISINDKELHVNGNYKKGLIGEFVSQYTTRVKVGKKTMTAVKGGRIENQGGGVYIAINGEVKDGEYQYF